MLWPPAAAAISMARSGCPFQRHLQSRPAPGIDGAVSRARLRIDWFMTFWMAVGVKEIHPAPTTFRRKRLAFWETQNQEEENNLAVEGLVGTRFVRKYTPSALRRASQPSSGRLARALYGARTWRCPGPFARGRSRTTISTSRPSALRNLMSRSVEKPVSLPRRSADTLG